MRHCRAPGGYPGNRHRVLPCQLLHPNTSPIWYGPGGDLITDRERTIFHLSPSLDLATNLHMRRLGGTIRPQSAFDERKTDHK